jgi:8-oxo-dGTP pyrophosphatase MutT (NUDIX family)
LADEATDETPDQQRWRASVRVICLDPSDRVLLLHWRDPVGGRLLWEPPGGGIDPGEDEASAARREVLEETGIAITTVPGRRVVVHRDTAWRGRRYTGDEPFLLARLPAAEPVRPTALTAAEDGALLEGRWLTWAEVLALTDAVEPPTLRDALSALDPTGPWHDE